MINRFPSISRFLGAGLMKHIKTQSHFMYWQMWLPVYPGHLEDHIYSQIICQLGNRSGSLIYTRIVDRFRNQHWNRFHRILSEQLEYHLKNHL